MTLTKNQRYMLIALLAGLVVRYIYVSRKSRSVMETNNVETRK